MADPKLFAFYQYLHDTKKVSDNTIELYLGYYQKIDPNLLSQDYVNAFIQKHKNNVVVRGMMLNLLQHLGIDHQIKLPPRPTGREEKKVIRPITKDEIEKVKTYLYGISFRHGLVFDLVYQGALRRFEVPTIMIKSFRWEAWDGSHENFCELVIKGKGKKQRIVLIDPETMFKIFNHYKEKINPEFMKNFYNSPILLFKRDDGSPYSEKMVYYIIKRGSKRILGRDIRPHELRHCRATELLERGASVHWIKTYLGHSSIAITEIYLHQSDEQNLKNIEKILKT